MFDSEDPPEERALLEPLAEHEHAHGLVIQTPIGLPPGLRKLRAVLLDLGICEDVFVLAALGEILSIRSVDPLHIVRMLRDGLLSTSAAFTYPLRIHGLTAYLGLNKEGEEAEAVYVLGVSVTTNALHFLRVKEGSDTGEDVINYADVLKVVSAEQLMADLSGKTAAMRERGTLLCLRELIEGYAEDALKL